jgi:hypothetical protein
MATAARISRTTTTHAVDVKRELAAIDLEMIAIERRLKSLREVLLRRTGVS